MVDEVIALLRRQCEQYPETSEDTGVGAPSFKVRGKIYAMQHPYDGRPSLWCKAPAGVQGALVATDPERYFVPPYVGQHGWVGTYLDGEIDWNEIAGIIEDSYRMTAPKRVLAAFDRAQKGKTER